MEPYDEETYMKWYEKVIAGLIILAFVFVLVYPLLKHEYIRHNYIITKISHDTHEEIRDYK